jgi:hypothetical protein
MSRRSTRPVYGHVIEPCRVTRGGVMVALLRVGLPFVGILALIDLAIWAVARAFGGCYGVWCWL